MRIDPEGRPISEFIEHLTHEQIESALFRPEIGILHPTVMMRAAAVRGVGGYRERFRHVEDLDLFLRLGEVGRLANLPMSLLHYRLHLASVSHLHTVEQAAAGRAAVAEARRRRRMPDPKGVADPDPGQVSEASLHRKWSWWAMSGGNLGTAWKHALRSFKREPTSAENARLLACLFRDSLKRAF